MDSSVRILVLAALLVWSGATVGGDLAIEEEWDLDEPCQSYIQSYARAQSAIIKCAVNHSSPPRVCTNCIEEYRHFKEHEYSTHHLENVTTKNHRTCSQVIYGDYLISYAEEVAHSVNNAIWEASKCTSCLDIYMDPASGNYTFAMNNQTKRFDTLITEWRECVKNHTGAQNVTATCERCEKRFNEAFDYYWQIYADPDLDFCVDVEANMNATTALWHEVWGCPDDGRRVDRSRDAVVVCFAATILVIVIALFYAGSYIQTESAQRDLIQYSRMEPPRGIRSRLISSSTTLDSYATGQHSAPSSSTIRG